MMEVRDLDVGDLLGLLESPQEEVAHEVRLLLKETFSTVRESWLITGILEYFYISNSGRLLDILLGVSEPHDRHLLDKLMEGLKGPDRFRHTCILLYAVRRQPPPTWLQKFINHGAMRELLRVLAGEVDVPVLVGAVMVIVILLPILPHEMGQLHLGSILDIFCRLVRWTPKRDIDEAFQPFLQVAVYSLFHRLYALYPCHFLTCLRTSFSKPNSSACFFTTLKPMMEKVRLHPLLITETKDSELTRNRWKGLETHQLILECAKLCLDPVESTCEDICGSFFVLSMNSESTFDALPIPTNWLLYAAENNFWSPSLALSSPGSHSHSTTPRGSSSSVPHTPVFPISAPSLKPMGRVAESPPEAAIEATPETTPFTSPIKLDTSNVVGRRPNTAVCALTLNTAVGKDNASNLTADVEACSSPLSPARKEQSPFKFPDDHYQNIFSRAERSSLINSKLQEILKERKQIQKESIQTSESKVEVPEAKEGPCKDVKDGKEREKSIIIPKKTAAEKQSISVHFVESEASTKESDIQVPQVDQGYRRRKMSMYDCKVDLGQLGIPTEKVSNGNDLDFMQSNDQDLETESEDGNCRPFSILDCRISEEKESNGSESRRSSDENQNEPCNEECEETETTLGLGVPNQRSMTDLVKNMKTMRLRFLSQCGPPPDLSHYNMVGTARMTVSPTKPGSMPLSSLHTSSSCPDLTADSSSQTTSVTDSRVRKESAISGLTLSPIRQAVVTSEATTQTEEITVVNPYEQLLDALLSGPTGKRKMSDSTTNEINMSSKSPHELLDQYLHFSSKTGSEGRNILWQQTSHLGFPYEGLKNHVRLLQVLLLIERYKREVHAERNRRLLGRAKKMYALEEQYQGLQAKVSHLENEVAHLKRELTNVQMNASSKEQQLQSALAQQEARISQLLLERDNSQEDRDVLRKQCCLLTDENSKLTSEIQGVQATLFDKDRQLTFQARMSEDNGILRTQMDELHKQICLMGEVQDQYKQEITRLKLTGGPSVKVGLELERVSAQQQIESLEEQCRITAAGRDAALSRVAELGVLYEEKCKQVEQEQAAVKAARDAGAEQCRAVELRCQALSSTNQTLESAILEQHDKNDRLVRQIRRSQRGKSVCSDGFDIDCELSASPGAGGDRVGIALPEGPMHTLGPLLSRQPVILNKLDALAEPETEPEGPLRRKT